LGKRGIKKTITGGKIKESFKIEKTKEGKRVAARRVFDDEEEKNNGPKNSNR